MLLSPIPEENFPTIHSIKEKAAKLKKSYMKRLKTHEGRRPKEEIFIHHAAQLLFKEKNPERKTGFSELAIWLSMKYSQETKYDFDVIKLYKWRAGKPFKEMGWQGVWDDIRISYEISHENASKKEMSQRQIQIKHGISKKDLEDFTGFILSQHAGNKKISNKFIFDRS